MLLSLISLLLGVIAAALLLRGTLFFIKYSTQWMTDRRPKVFPRPSRCPRCEQRIGRFGRLRSIKNVLFGGWSCPGCGSEFDQLDNILVARAWNAHLRDFEKRSRKQEQFEIAGDDRTPLQKLLDD